MEKEQVNALMQLGEQATIIYLSALKNSGSTETAKVVAELFLRAILKPDATPKFFM